MEVSNWVGQYFECKKNGIIPILGFETFINNYNYNAEDNTVECFELNNNWKKDLSELTEDEKSLVQIDYNICLYAKTLNGYYNIIKIHNEAQISHPEKPKVNDTFLLDKGEGVIALLPPYSEFGSALYNGDNLTALKKYKQYSSIFDDVYVGIALLKDKEYSEIADNTIKFCQRNKIKMIPILNSHYVEKEDEELFYTMNQMQKIKTGIRIDIDRVPEMYMRDKEEVYYLWKEFYESPVFTELVFAKMNLELDNLLSKIPLLELDTDPKTPHFENSEKMLYDLSIEGLKKKGLFGKKEYMERFEDEYNQITKAGFADYFILLEDVCRWCWSNDVKVGTGRGSAAGSLILYLLGITHVDPIPYNLIFTRFINLNKLIEIVEQGGKISGCFTGDTMVKTNYGIKQIKDIKEGDLVFGSDNKLHKVLNLWENGYQTVYDFVYEKDDKQYQITATAGHIVKTIKNGLEVEEKIGNIKKGGCLVSPFHAARNIVSYKKIKTQQPVYDIEVENDHHYIVCGKRVKLKNKAICSDFKSV
jgi:hypothetical protein